tara:strand:- start:1291 stop:2613 length:1323 start_codon:yes stop_codon:yes gene_type:complete
MNLFSKISFSKFHYLNLLLALFPFSFIAGNMIININILLIVFSTVILFQKELFKIKFFILDKLIFLFFFLIIFTGLFNDYNLWSEKDWKGSFPTLIKSIFFLKYLLFYLVLRFLIEKKIVDLKVFFIFTSAAVLFVALDICFQYFNGKDIFGITPPKGYRQLSGPFGDELIAGGFIQRFSLFAFFLLPLFFNNKISSKFYKYLIPALFIIFFSSLLLSGNRMPTIMFLFSIFLILIFQKQTRKFFLPFLLIFSLVFTILFKLNEPIRLNSISFYSKSSQMVSLILKKDFFNESSPQYLKEFSTFYDTWLMNKYIGGGIKNFRYYCHARKNINKDSKFICNMHPHNYYLEILTETGIFGFLIVLSIFLSLIYLTLIKKYFLNSSFKENNIIIPFIFLLIAEIFPLRSTGSFFTTGNTTYIILILSIMVGLIRNDNSIENQK